MGDRGFAGRSYSCEGTNKTASCLDNSIFNFLYGKMISVEYWQLFPDFGIRHTFFSGGFFREQEMGISFQ
jgi:hypothetical protein